MTIEQKAAAYDEAIERAKDFMNGEVHYELKIGENIMCWVFPELRESEDEKIRKEIIELVKFYYGSSLARKQTVSKDEMVAWLEKQGESDETKAKTILINKGYPIDANGTFPTYEEMYDIIKEGLEKQGEQKPTTEIKSAEESLGIDSETYNKIVDECIYGEQKPAETEKGAKGNEREIPFSEQKWSEEDEKKLNRIYTLLAEAANKHAFSTTCRLIGDKECVELQDFLKSLRPQKQWKPSDEQMDMLSKVCSTLHLTSGENEIMESIYDALKKLKDEK